MGALFLLLTLFLLVILKITNDSINGFGYGYGFSLESFQDAAAAVAAAKGANDELLIIKAAWCGHCRNAAPEFKKLVDAKTITTKSGQVLKVRMLDSETDKAEIKALDIKGYPTIMTRVGDKMHEYPGDRTAAAVKQYFAELSL
jgi:thiol-disulfide isomerase/thioredoxin